MTNCLLLHVYREKRGGKEWTPNTFIRDERGRNLILYCFSLAIMALLLGGEEERRRQGAVTGQNYIEGGEGGKCNKRH